MRVVDGVIAAGWVAFWIYWLVASVGAKPGRSAWNRFALIRVAAIVLVLVLVRAGAFRGHSTTKDPWLQGIGLVLFLSGLGVAVWARVCIGTNWGMPMSEKTDPELVTTGPYGLIRHPIYSGLILALTGTAVAVNLYLLVLPGLFGTYFVYAATMEERHMTELFPDSYPEYKRSTKMLIPFIF
jgi:protein-S-isoprenylcysteine O-methyltransferase Ste14